jgi:sugar phosphate isomerase/epimerase
MHDRISINSICLAQGSLEQLNEYWRELGARRVSLISPMLPLEQLHRVQTVLQDGDYELETIMHPFLAGQHLDAAEEHQLAAGVRFNQFVAAAMHLKARSIYTVPGGHGSLTWEDAAERFCRAIAPCVAFAREAGIALMVENSPPLYAEVQIAHSLRDAITLAEMAGIGVVIDVFGCWTEAGLRESIRRAVPRCQLVQLSDYVYGDRSLPARAVPGDGAIPLHRILDWLLEAGYTGTFDLELVGPRIEREGTLRATRRAAENVSAILRSLGA